MLRPAPSSATDAPRSFGFLLVFALAYAGGVVGYLPLLSLLLPIKVAAVAGEVRLGLLTAALLSGAISASIANILFGWLSDRSLTRGKGRRSWIAAGAVATIAAYAGLAAAQSPATIIGSVVLFQVALNAMLAPLVAVMADEIPDSQKGLTGGLLALATPLASALGALLVGTALLGPAARLMAVPLIAALFVLPLLFSLPRPLPPDLPSPSERQLLRGDMAIAWGARLLVQVAGSVLSLYLLYYFESVEPQVAPAALAQRVGLLLTLAHAVPLPIAVLIGRISDRIGRRKPFLLGAAIVAALGLVGMALAQDWTQAVAAFALNAIGWAVFVTLHAAFAMQLLPDPAHRGRDLGFINLANTLPALLGPTLAWLLATPRDFDLLMFCLAGLTLCGGFMILGAKARR